VLCRGVLQAPSQEKLLERSPCAYL
jgi:hypothetical protein